MASGSISPNLISGLSFRDSILLLMVLLTTVLGVLLIHVALHTWVIGGSKVKNRTNVNGGKKMQCTEEVVLVEKPAQSEEQIEKDGFPEILLNKTVRFLLPPISRVARESVPHRMERLLKRRNAITADNYLTAW